MPSNDNETPVMSIRRQLALHILGGTAALLLVTGAAFCALIHVRLVGEFDRALEVRAGMLESLTSREARRIDLDFGAVPGLNQDGEAEFYAVFLGDGTVLKKSLSLGAMRLSLDLDAGKAGRVFRNVVLPDGRPGRQVQAAFAPKSDDPDAEATAAPDADVVELPAAINPETIEVVLVVARSRERLNGLLASFYGTVAALAVLLLGSIRLVVQRAMNRGFRTLDDMNAQITRIGPESPEARVRLSSPPTELTTLLVAVNGLLERVQAGIARERQFSSDVAHELRTPVAELRAASEVGAAWPDDAGAVRQFFADTRDIALQMERIVENLTALSRADGGEARIERRSIGIARLVEQCWERIDEPSVGGQLRLDNRIAPALVIESDPEMLGIIIRNLLDNAVEHGTPQTVIRCEASVTNGTVVLLFANPATGLTNEDMPHVFERFWRKDPARAGSRHSGLGLAIVKSLAAHLGIRIHSTLREGTVFEVRLALPQNIASP